MKVILLENVSKVGQKYEVKEVASGYALNFLIRKGLAKLATKSEIKNIEDLKASNKKKEEKLVVEFKQIIQELSGQKIIIESKVNDKGHLFKGLHEKDLLDVLKAQKGVEISPDQIKLQKPIKEVGDHQVEIVGSDLLSGKVVFSVVAAK